ncbi:hypothetical protein RHGRI_015212 [Rhododendron griersonianum]|uniref:Uncharacterized protein n=1 Tax=Rhododendron griersonianum TaxID=479676 RepID=A0AAV6KCG1_9ERIC|nr:hypothetical protein RHGRI_015212 [Rhododendron griersonianum]
MKNLELKTKLKEYDAMERKVEQLEGMESKLKEDKQKMKLQLQKHANNQSRWLEQYQMHIHLESIPVRDATQMVHLQIAIAVNGHAPSQWGGKEDL